jgi:predicted GNAT family N-acyltransferase/gamma-glutamylcyclotransferase (GGCT)/AIG2-like uncharacterized protein YtfP
VYGTLRRLANHPAHQVLAERAKLIGTGKVQGKLYALGRFPGVTPSQQRTDRVRGEIYALDDKRRVFQFLDKYEGSLFRRELCPVYLNAGQKLSAWIYLYVGPMNSAKFISSGDYLSLRARKPRPSLRIARTSSKAGLQKAFDIRMRVFVKEQRVSREIELDSDDGRAVHFLATISGNAIGTARIVMRRGSAKIGRMAVLKSFRRGGVGKKLLKHAVACAKKLGAKKIYLHAQVAVIGFYKRAGFRCVGPVFDEAGIPHRRMILATGLAVKNAKGTKKYVGATGGRPSVRRT